MDTTSELRQRLQTLSIPKDQRPQARSGGRLVRNVILLVVLGGGGYGGYHAWQTGTLQKVAGTVASAASDAAASSSTAKPTATPTMIVRAAADASAPPVLTSTGKIVSDHQVAVSTKVSGQIVELRFEQGDRVEAGQVLARLEDINYKARVDEAEGLLRRAKATAEFERFNHRRMLDLQSEQRASEVEVNASRRALDEAEAQIATEQARLDFARKLLRDCEVVAPIAGVILERNVEVGDFVAAEGGRGANANAQFTSIADMSKLRVEVDVSELDVSRLRKGMPCTVVPDAYKDRKYAGRIMWIDPGANYAKATVQVKVRIENPDDYLRVEGSAQVQFLTEAPATGEAKATIWLPSSAVLVDKDGSAFVFVADDKAFHKTPVTRGRVSGSQIEIVAGVRDGQSIAAGGVDKLSDGQSVK